ncbi:tetratricopeptide repeat protein [Pseudokineococcus sp. 5B2Z-1]|uniref:tetratricopeptide repeat protein n=1 Tax=Pseudokineococcus sp. 5B2Z-1 TaxID=3132744 RepID=UPI0030B293C9
MAEDAQTLVDAGCDASDQGRHREAEGLFRRAVDLGEEWVWFNIGNELRAQGRLTDAVKAYQRALAAGETDAWLNLGACLDDLGDLVAAMDAYRGAAAAGDLTGYVQLAHLLREHDEGELAVEALSTAAEEGSDLAAAVLACWEWDRTLDPTLELRLRAGAEHYSSARADLADLLRSTGRPEEARAELERGCAAGQRDCWLPLGNHLADHAGDPVAAEAAYRAGIDAGDSNCHHNLAILLLDLGRTHDAITHLRAGADAGDALAARALRDVLDERDDT